MQKGSLENGIIPKIYLLQIQIFSVIEVILYLLIFTKQKISKVLSNYIDSSSYVIYGIRENLMG